MLFSLEFLRAARDRLAPGGVYVQWYHLYENNDRSVALVLENYAQVFDQVEVWRSQSTDLLLVGLRDADHSIDLARLEQRAAQPDMRKALARIGIEDPAQLLVHESVPLGVVHASGPSALPPHTLYHPRLSYYAGIGFFAGGQAQLPFSLLGGAARIGTRNSLLHRYLDRFAGHPPDEVWERLVDRACSVSLPECPTLAAAWSRDMSPEAASAHIAGLRTRYRPTARLDLVPLLRFFYGELDQDVPAGPPDQIAQRMNQYAQHYSYALPFESRSLVALWQHCEHDGVFGPLCQRGLHAAERFAATGQLPAVWAYEAAEP
jgi:hypothetical protein